jgi:uncharacterized membrane protein YccF (DUF307 family)
MQWVTGPLEQGGTVVRAILNVIWLVLCGVWMSICYVLAGLVCFVLIITIPFGIAAFRIAGYVLWPFGRTIEQNPHAGVASIIGTCSGSSCSAGGWRSGTWSRASRSA